MQMAESSEGERERSKWGFWHGHHEVQPVASSSLFCPLQLNLAVASDADCEEREEEGRPTKEEKEEEDMLAAGGLAKLAVASRKEAIRTF